MKKLTSILFPSLIAFNAYSVEPVVIKVNTNLVDKKIIKTVNDSVAKFLEYEGDKISGGLSGEIYQPMIKELTKIDGKVAQLKIESKAFYISYDYDFGDPVDEEETTCVTTLKKSSSGSYELYELKDAKSYCDFVPADNDTSGEDPCCENGEPIVDSNWCFDYYEEGAEYCSATSWDYP